MNSKSHLFVRALLCGLADIIVYLSLAASKDPRITKRLYISVTFLIDDVKKQKKLKIKKQHGQPFFFNEQYTGS